MTLETTNSKVSLHLQTTRKRQADTLEAKIAEFEEDQNKLNAKMKLKYKDAFNIWMDFRNHKKEAKANAAFKIKEENALQNQRNKEIRAKLQKSQKAVEDFIRERDHQFMLKQELRKLREDDMQKVKQRRKRLELKRKIDIITKEKQDNEVREEVKRREKILIETRYENTVKSNFEKINLTKEILDWTHKGYSTTKESKKKLRLDHSPEIEEKIRDIKNPKLFDKKKDE